MCFMTLFLNSSLIESDFVEASYVLPKDCL